MNQELNSRSSNKSYQGSNEQKGTLKITGALSSSSNKSSIQWNIKTFSNNKIFVPIPSRTEIQLLITQALSSRNNYKPLQSTCLSDRKAVVKNSGFKKCRIKGFKKEIFNFNGECPKKNLNFEEEKKRDSTDVSRNEEIKNYEVELEDSRESSEEELELDEDYANFERREKQRVSEAKKMVREVFSNIRACREKKFSDYLKNEKERNLVDFEHKGIVKLIKKSKFAENKAKYYRRKLKFFVAKIGRKVGRSVSVAAEKKKEVKK